MVSLFEVESHLSPRADEDVRTRCGGPRKVRFRVVGPLHLKRDGPVQVLQKRRGQLDFAVVGHFQFEERLDFVHLSTRQIAGEGAQNDALVTELGRGDPEQFEGIASVPRLSVRG